MSVSFFSTLGAGRLSFAASGFGFLASAAGCLHLFRSITALPLQIATKPLPEVAPGLACVAMACLTAALCFRGYAKRNVADARGDNARFLAAAEGGLDAFLLLEAMRDAEGEIEDFSIAFLNRRAQELFSVPHADLLGGQLCKVLPVFAREGLLGQYKDVLLSGKQSVTEFCVADEHIRGTWLRCSVVKLGDGVAVTLCNLTAHKEAEKLQRDTSQHDALTGLPNRSLLDDRIQQAIERAKRNHGRATLMIVDLSDFEQLNQTYGQDAGDHVLKTVATRLRNAVRATDSVFRLGADEFVILFSDLPTSEPVADLGQKIIATLLPPIPWRRKMLNIDASIGSAMYPGAGTSPETLLVQADIAMFRMKRAQLENATRTGKAHQLDLSAFPLSIG